MTDRFIIDMIQVENLKKSFSGLQAVKNISFEMKKGEVVGFLGPNGAGKTTTMRILSGFLPATDGFCSVAGFDMSQNSYQARQKIGYLPESNPLYIDMEVTEYLHYMARLRQMPRSNISAAIQKVSQRCGLEKISGRKLSEVSKGYRQRVGLAQSLIHEPEILILDEPTVGLDPNQIVEIRNLIQEIGEDHTVLLSTHILSEVEQTCERVIIINEGEIVGQGTPQELMSQTQGGHLYQTIIRGPKQDIIQALQSLEGAQDVTSSKSESDCHYFVLKSSSEDDQREKIFRLVVEHSWSLLELKKEDLSLEDVFKNLTQ